ncbi:hypothetical protein RCL1_005485 [Eukaryota sp. TZLM3-RCL]
MNSGCSSSHSPVSSSPRGVKKRKKKLTAVSVPVVETVSLTPSNDDYSFAVLSQRKELTSAWLTLLNKSFEDEPLDLEVVHSQHSDLSRPHCHVSLMTNKQGEVICGCSFDCFPESATVLIGYMATHPNYKRQGLASKVLNEGLRVICSTMPRNGLPLLVFAEVSTDESGISARPFWNAKGFKRIDFPYYLPPAYRKNTDLEEEYMLTAFDPDDIIQGNIPTQRVINFLQAYYDWCNTREDQGIVTMLDRLGLNSGCLKLVDIPV